MKRLTNLYEKVISIENLELADKKASKGKALQYGVIQDRKNSKANIERLHLMLRDKTFRTSQYSSFKIKDPKEREVFRLPYYPDRIVHHAIMNILEPMFVSVFTADTYSCIKGRGVHAASYALRHALRDAENTRYYLQIDIKKFYPSIDHSILKQLLRRKIKDNDLLWLLDEIIDSAPGVPIGNYLSQYFANFYVAFFDHWIKETKAVKYYFRYADDIIIPASNKPYLHALLSDIRKYLHTELKLELKPNYRIAPVEPDGINFCGYIHFPRYTLMRKRIKRSFVKMLRYRRNRASIASYTGWAKHANTINLLRKIL